MEKDADDGDDNEELDVSKEEEFKAESVKSLDIGNEDKVKMEEVPKDRKQQRNGKAKAVAGSRGDCS
ncbi:hypothetical protein KXD40_009299 [Peronospora effusa]|nr:hypothetical protein KXD40_009299 [Peronospora effusa]